MKKFLFTLTIFCFFLSCKRTLECCVLVDTFVDISVLEKSTNKDLLNPGLENHYDIKKVTLEFSDFPNQRTGIDAIQMNQPLFFRNSNRYYLRIFPTTYEPVKEIHTVTIYWNETSKDKITFHLNLAGGNMLTEKIFVNDELKWDTSKGYRETTILK
ncbi:hypothetical protein [Emticicia sp. BO119]|uniref:hypothetical protein n=1 Tax=Emticicia sp. BO119 TaxID=2757768 RepID=UPI0015F106C3|nr:hypothetical protein [Emticicia sp. BO119]MBA4849755.1 hypothetical protein [Emticicia sp. BO119]